MRLPFFCFLLLFVSGGFSPAGPIAPALSAKVEPLPAECPLGPFIRLADGTILTVDTKEALLSTDGGKTWKTHPIFASEQEFSIRPERALIQSRNGTVILAFANDKERSWTWSKEEKDAKGATLPTYVCRSRDGGRTWSAPQKLHAEWTGAIRDMIETREGRVVFTSMVLLHDPGRHATVTYSSNDDGATWKRSNILDIGGVGHHDGAIEATMEELRDGRVWMLMRTTLDTFWEAFSEDGVYWRTIRPSRITASTAPAMLKRLQSGRLLLVWNQLHPEGKGDFPRRGGDGQWSEVPAINHRGELSVAFSEDEGKTWSLPHVIARAPAGEAQDVSYPYVFEAEPGKLWITSMRGGLRCCILEKDFLPGS